MPAAVCELQLHRLHVTVTMCSRLHTIVTLGIMFVACCMQSRLAGQYVVGVMVAATLGPGPGPPVSQHLCVKLKISNRSILHAIWLLVLTVPQLRLHRLNKLCTSDASVRPDQASADL